MRLVRYTAIVLVLLGCAGCPKKNVENFSGIDREMVEGARQIRLAINAYNSSQAEYPPDIQAVAGFLPPGVPWPTNPYNGQPISDNGSAEFDPTKSVGTVYYEVYFRNDMATGYRLHVFGETGRLMIFDNSAFGAQ